jgi:hypothetical protein
VLRRALCLFAIAVPCVLPAHAQAKSVCGSASVAAGAAPLTVTFTSACGAVHWDFGDGTTSDGETAEHTFAAGAWTVYASDEKVAVITSRAVSLRVPHLVGFRHRLTFRGAVVPPLDGERVLVLVRGRFLASARTRANGTFSVTRRITSPGPYAARWVDARSDNLATTVKPRIAVRIVGTPVVGRPLVVRARLVPPSAGTVRIRVWRGRRLVVDAHRAHVKLATGAAASYRVRVTSSPAEGFAAASRTLAAAVALLHLSRGAVGSSVRALEERLVELHYAVDRVDGVFGQDDYDAVLAFQKVSGLSRTGEVDAALWRRLQRASVPAARYRGNHVEVDKSRQVLFEVRGGAVALVVQVSTGATGNTPVGLWHVYSRVPGWSWVLWYPTYFLRGFAIHGYPDVPPWPASHGCVRVPMWIATRLYAMHPYGFPIYIY